MTRSHPPAPERCSGRDQVWPNPSLAKTKFGQDQLSPNHVCVVVVVVAAVAVVVVVVIVVLCVVVVAKPQTPKPETLNPKPQNPKTLNPQNPKTLNPPAFRLPVETRKADISRVVPSQKHGLC